MIYIIYVIAIVLVGIAITFLVLFASAQSMMFNEKESRYNFNKTASMLEESAKTHQWRIPAVHDMQKSINSIGKDVPRTNIFELCKPEHAYEVMSRDAERIIAPMLPCRIAIYEKADGKTYLSWMNLNIMGKMMKGVIPNIMKKVERDINEIIAPMLK